MVKWLRGFSSARTIALSSDGKSFGHGPKWNPRLGRHSDDEASCRSHGYRAKGGLGRELQPDHRANSGFAKHLQLALDGRDCFGVRPESICIHAERELPDRSDSFGNVAYKESDGSLKGKHGLVSGTLGNSQL